MKYLIRNKALFLMGILIGETQARLRARCRELELRNYSGLDRKQLIQVILDHTEESVIAYTFEPELVAA